MKKMIVGFLAILFTAGTVYSQNVDSAKKEMIKNGNLDLAIGFGKGVVSPSLSFQHYFSIGKVFRVGPGVRLFMAQGKDLRFAEENTELEGGNNADGAAAANAFTAKESRLGGLNVGAYFKFIITPKIEAGLNMDLVGIPLGNQADGTLTKGENTETYAVTKAQQVSVNTFFNRGNVANELWVGYRFDASKMIRVGVNATGTMYKVPSQSVTGIAAENYERINFLGFVAFSHSF